MINNYIIVFDFETGGLDVTKHEIIQIGSLVIDPRSLRPVEGGEFESLMRPVDFNLLTDDALRINKKTKEELREAPVAEEVWLKWAGWCKQWTLKGKSDNANCPVPAGHNICNFDWPLYVRYAHQFGTVRTNKKGLVEPNIFNNNHKFDTIQMLKDWFFDLEEPSSISLDSLRRYFDIPRGERSSHDALQDVRDTGAILTKVLNLYRTFAPKVIFKNCFNQAKVKDEMERRKKRKK